MSNTGRGTNVLSLNNDEKTKHVLVTTIPQGRVQSLF